MLSFSALSPLGAADIDAKLSHVITYSESPLPPAVPASDRTGTRAPAGPHWQAVTCLGTRTPDRRSVGGKSGKSGTPMPVGSGPARRARRARQQRDSDAKL